MKNTRNRFIFAAAFAAMIAVSGFLIIPVPGIPVPIVLKNLFIVLSGTILGSFYGSVAVLIFIIAGIIGVPVFVIPGGIAVFTTPLGGYIIGYFLASLTAGLICGLPETSEKKARGKLFCGKSSFFLFRLILASVSGFGIILMCGVLFNMRLNSMSFMAAMTTWFLPFVIGDLIKLALSIPLALQLRPIAARYINQ